MNVLFIFQEQLVVCRANEKPLLLLHLLQAESQGAVIVFSSSVDVTHRYFEEGCALLIRVLW